MTEFASCQIYGETDDFLFLLLKELGIESMTLLSLESNYLDSCNYSCASYSSGLDELKSKYETKQTLLPEKKTTPTENVGNYKKAHINLLAEVKSLKKV